MVIKTKISNLPKELQHDIYSIAVGKNPYLIGTGSITSLTYNSDFDLNERIIVKDLQEHINDLKKEKNIWITSIHDTKEYIQINTICNVNGILTDVNDTIFHSKQPSKRELSNSLKKDIHSFIEEKNYFKAVKRLFAFLSLNKKKNQKYIDYLIEFLNSNIGLLSNIINQLNIILMFAKVERNRPELIFNNLEICKLSLNKIYCVPIGDELFSLFSLKNINKLINILDKKLQDYTKSFISLNKHLF